VSNSTIWAKQGNIDVLADVSGSANLSIPVTDASGEDNRYVSLFNTNSGYTGSIDVAGRFQLEDNGGLTFVIGASGVNNGVSGSGTALFDGDFTFDLSGASAAPGDSWTIASVANQTFGATFSVVGFSESADVWTSGAYQFDESTGVLSVVPEPTSVALIFVGVAVAVTGSRRRDS
jgi:hypothetical protein